MNEPEAQPLPPPTSPPSDVLRKVTHTRGPRSSCRMGELTLPPSDSLKVHGAYQTSGLPGLNYIYFKHPLTQGSDFIVFGQRPQ